MNNYLLAILVFYPIIGALLTWIVGLKNEKVRDYLADFVAISEFILMIYAAMQGNLSCELKDICGFGLHFTLDGFRDVYGSIAALMWMMTTILSREYFTHHENRNRFYLFLLLTLGATMGVFLSSDLYTTFIFFEMMSFTSYVWVAQEENQESLRAAITYLAVAIIGGLVMLMGLFMLYHELGTLTISELLPLASVLEDKTLIYIAGICMLVGFGAKAGAFPLHIWLPKAHPVAPAPASALLSGILTKTGIFGILVITSHLFLHDATWGMLILILGIITMFGGALLAVFSVDLKRTLACSSMSQIGFIMIGIGMQCLLAHDNALAVHGTFLHMINHSLIKLVLFMAAGVIFMNTHALNLNKIRGFGKNKNLLKVIFLIGALAIAGIPMFSGYISKTLLHESIVEFGGGMLMTVIEWIFLFSGGLTLAYMTKIFVAIFVETNSDSVLQEKYDNNKKYMNVESTFALGVSALILLVWGLFPHQIMDKVAALGESFMHFEGHGHEVHYFNLTNLSGGFISIVIGVIVYFFFIRKFLMKDNEYVNKWPVWLDMENLIYRPILLGFLPIISRFICRIFDSAIDTIAYVLRKTLYKDSPIPHRLTEGNMFTEKIGKWMNAWQSLANRTYKKNNPTNINHQHTLAMKYEELNEDRYILVRSMSLGLLLVCLGLCVTLIYIILL